MDEIERLLRMAAEADEDATRRLLALARRRADRQALERLRALGARRGDETLERRAVAALLDAGCWAARGAARTDLGPVRSVNEDACCLLPRLGGVVLDGMGGSMAGRAPAALAARLLGRALAGPDGPFEVLTDYDFARGEEHATIDALLAAFDRDALPALLALPRARRLTPALTQINTLLWRLASAPPTRWWSFQGSGATLAAALLADGALHVAHVGDCRVYRLRDRQLTLLTRDHSLLNAYLDQGLLEASAARAFPYRRVMLRVLGMREAIAVDTQTLTPLADDRYLLCSDGLHDPLTRDTLTRLLCDAPDPEAATAALIAAARAADSPDNITALVLDLR